jgi:peptide deformylase
VIHPIRYFGDPVLRRRALRVTRFDDALAQLADDMIETMYDAAGVGLAAPQIGVPKRLFVALQLEPEAEDDEVGEELAHDDETEPIPDDETPEQMRRRLGVLAEHVMVNPTFLLREGVQHGQDGCLSVPGVYVDALRRDLHVRVRYQDVEGTWHETDAEGHFAHVLQHEYDHLEGVLFFDRLEGAERLAFLEEHRAALADIQRQAKALLKELRASPIPVSVQ